ncbi:DUF4212 domain-containing protein [Halegenticoccus soli]|uniref:DUF4212 domain-containing protein n=1 Tax=Halegenticoccus soli TaxID=1985678 RepID=UPI000C6DFB66|nr:DUF4212 domain-containing protein [Halegenticoccus soli]
MIDDDSSEPTSDSYGAETGTGGSHDVETDGGVTARHETTDYLDAEINLLSPSTPYMREHQRIVWTGFIVWSFTTFGPITATRIAPDLMTAQMPILGFPFHYFAIAIGGPTSALLLSVWYARQRDKLDAKYGIDHSAVESGGREDATVADGGATE